MKLNDQIICVNAEPNKNKKPGRRIPDGTLVEGEVYTVIGFDENGDPIITCKRVKNGFGENVGWRKDRFRPVTEADGVDLSEEEPADEGWD